MKKNKDTVGLKIKLSQRVIISLLVAVSIAMLSYAGLEAVIRTVDSRNRQEFDKHVDECADYAVYAVNSCNADGDIGKAMGEIATMAYSLSGRILVVDTEYKVVIDSYGKDVGKYMTSPSILDVMLGKQSEITESDDSVYRKVMPVINSEGYTDAVS